MGDSKAGPSTRRFGQEPALLEQLQRTMVDVDLRLIQVIRNPYDPISAMIIRGGRTFENAIDHYFDYCETLLRLRQQLPDASLLAVRYEDFVHEPKKHLTDLCRFLGIEAERDYLNACAGIVKESPEQYRHLVEWSPRWISIVRDRMNPFDFLTGYAYEL
jgi:hypothetical protein